MEWIPILINGLVLILVAVLLFKKKTNNNDQLTTDFRQLLQQEFVQNRLELSKNFQQNREELTLSIDRLTEMLIQKAKDDRGELRTTLKDFQESFSKKGTKT